MAMNSLALGKPGLEITISETLRNVTRKLRKRSAWKKTYTTTFQELKRLSDRDLSDLGMARTDIHRIAKDAANDTIGAL